MKEFRLNEKAISSINVFLNDVGTITECKQSIIDAYSSLFNITNLSRYEECDKVRFLSNISETLQLFDKLLAACNGEDV